MNVKPTRLHVATVQRARIQWAATAARVLPALLAETARQVRTSL